MSETFEILNLFDSVSKLKYYLVGVIIGMLAGIFVGVRI